MFDFNKQEIKKLFLDLVKIYSPSGKELKIADYIIKYLHKIGISAYYDGYGNILAQVSGAGKPIALVSHMDTVEPAQNVKPIIRDDLIKTDGSTILGADNKAGITEILSAIAYLRKNNIRHRSLELIFTKEEEAGLRGSLNLDFSKIKSKEVLVIDSCNPLGTIIIASPFVYVINIIIKGKAAHSGAHPERGINAISIAAKAINKLKLGRVNKSTSINIGIIHGGVAINIIPELVEIQAEVRSYTKNDAKKEIEKMKMVFKDCTKKYKALCRFKYNLVCGGYFHRKNDDLIKTITRINEKLGIKTTYKQTGSGSDANIFAMRKIKAINIAYGGKNMHTTKESIKLNEIVKMSKFLVEFLSSFR